MCLAQGHSTMTVVPRLGIEPGTPGFKSPVITTRPRRIPENMNGAMRKTNSNDFRTRVEKHIIAH